MRWVIRQVRAMRDAVAVVVFENIARLFPDTDHE